MWGNNSFNVNDEDEHQNRVAAAAAAAAQMAARMSTDNSAAALLQAAAANNALVNVNVPVGVNVNVNSATAASAVAAVANHNRGRAVAVGGPNHAADYFHPFNAASASQSQTRRASSSSSVASSSDALKALEERRMELAMAATIQEQEAKRQQQVAAKNAYERYIAQEIVHASSHFEKQKQQLERERLLTAAANAVGMNVPSGSGSFGSVMNIKSSSGGTSKINREGAEKAMREFEEEKSPSLRKKKRKVASRKKSSSSLSNRGVKPETNDEKRKVKRESSSGDIHDENDSRLKKSSDVDMVDDSKSSTTNLKSSSLGAGKKGKKLSSSSSSTPSTKTNNNDASKVTSSDSKISSKKSSRSNRNNDEDKDSVLVSAIPSRPSTSSSSSTRAGKSSKSATPRKRKKSSSSSSTPAANKKKSIRSTSQQKTPKTPKTPTTLIPVSLTSGSHPNLHEEVPKITKAEYTNLDALMSQFCKVPLLAEFSRPVSLLHPELIPLYSKVVKDPIDLGKVCRAIRKRQYTNTRQVCVDIWRIFANCVKYHTHPCTREGAIPSFVSIANHLREYFNALWMEYMIPSEITAVGTGAIAAALKNADEKRTKLRVERYNALVATLLSANCVENAAKAIENFVEKKGKVDDLDKTSIDCANDEEEDAMASVFKALSSMAARLRQIAPSDVEYPVEALGNDLKRCIGNEVFEGCDALRNKLEKRIDRLLGKIIAPINEATCRGVNQSSVWGCMAAAIWARETTKRPYWPAIVLGILAPDDQSEDWHRFLTERNEARLPFKLLQGLQNGKKKATQALIKQSEGKAERMSFFLVEFLGTHEFIWVREADIIENFDPDEDPNTILARSSGKKTKKSSRNSAHANSKILSKAIDEGRWALEEFEMQLNDPCGDQIEEYAEDEENYSFPVLCESDDEADEADGGLGDQNDLGDCNVFGSPTGKLTDVDEIHELLFTDGVLDYSTNGRKLAKRRATAFKKFQTEAKKAANLLKKEKEEKAKKLKNAKKAKAASLASKAAKESSKKSTAASNGGDKAHSEKELIKRRKKRERERATKQKEQDKKRLKTDGNSLVRRGRKVWIADKRGRASAIVRGYLHKMTAKNEIKGLGLGGVLTIPSAAVESTGLLGMALAFRAAAGELEMPNTSDNSSCFKPWESIDVDRPQTSAERCANLEKKIKMMQQAIKTLKSNDERRKQLIEAAKKEKEDNFNLIMQAEKDARQNEMPKRKSVGKKKAATGQVKEEEKSIVSKEATGDDAFDDEERSSVDLSSPVKVIVDS